MEDISGLFEKTKPADIPVSTVRSLVGDYTYVIGNEKSPHKTITRNAKFTYIAKSRSCPGLFKIGRTKDLAARENALHHTPKYKPYELEMFAYTPLDIEGPLLFFIDEESKISGNKEIIRLTQKGLIDLITAGEFVRVNRKKGLPGKMTRIETTYRIRGSRTGKRLRRFEFIYE